jgi:hypothetical protein
MNYRSRERTGYANPNPNKHRAEEKRNANSAFIWDVPGNPEIRRYILILSLIATS